MPRAKTSKTPKNGNGTKTVAAQAAVAHNGNGSLDLEQMIRQRAYELFEQRGYQPGREQDDWFAAEQQVRAKHAVAGA